MGCASPVFITREDAIGLLIDKGLAFNNDKLEQLLENAFGDELTTMRVVSSYSDEDRDYNYPNRKWRFHDE
jgi:hypothetical protein